MDYKELAEMCRYLSDTPSYTAFHDEMEREVICDSCKGGLCYEKVQDANWCMYEALQRAATAITDLLARAEAAEARVHELETSYRLEKCENGPECVELGRVRKALAAAEARAEKAERERDAAIQDISGICYLCANAKPYSALSRTVMTCEHKKYCGTKSPGCEHFKWRGNKEE